MQHIVAKYMSLPCRRKAEPSALAAAREKMSKEMAVALLRQQVYTPISHSYDSKATTVVRMELPRSHVAQKTILDAFITLGFFISSIDTGLQIAYEDKKKGVVARAAASINLDRDYQPEKGQAFEMDKEHVRQLLEAGVKNPVLNVVAKEAGIELSHAARTRHR